MLTTLAAICPQVLKRYRQGLQVPFSIFSFSYPSPHDELIQAPDEPDENVDGVSAADIPKLLPNVVRMELTGGFVLQRIAPDQMFFRYILMSPYVLWDVEISFQYRMVQKPSMVAFRLSIVPFVKEKGWT